MTDTDPNGTDHGDTDPPTSNPGEPRLATREEFPEILDLVDRCFNHPAGGIPGQWNHCYDETNPERHAVITADGQVLSQVSIVEDVLAVDGGQLRTWGITGVATDPRHRGKGYMTALLEFWLDRMDTAGVPFAHLAGDRQRYGRFGWERVGHERFYRVSKDSVLDLPVRDEFVSRYDGSDEAIETVREHYETLPYRVKREPADYRERLGRSHLETVLYSEPGHEAYLTFTRDRSRSSTVTELAGSGRGIMALLGYVFRTFGKSPVTVRMHPDDPLNQVLGSWDVSERWETKPHRSVNIRRLPAVLDSFETQLTRRVRGESRQFGERFESGSGFEYVDESGSVILEIEDDSEAARISWNGDCVSVSTTDDDPDVELSRLAMARLLFGYPETVPDYDGHSFLDAILPLELYIPRTDQV